MKAHDTDAGYDLRTPTTQFIAAHSSIVIDTGVHFNIPKGHYGKLESKSGLNVKHSIVSLGGVIDSGYTGSVKVKLYNMGGQAYVFAAGDKIVQIVFMRCDSPALKKVDEFEEETERGSSGFGSSGK